MQINIQQAQRCLADLALRASQGEQIIIAQENGEYLQLIPYKPITSQRQAGLLKGKASIIDIEWSQPSDELTNEFYPK